MRSTFLKMALMGAGVGAGMSGGGAFDPKQIGNLLVWLRSDVGLYKDAAKTDPAVAEGDAIYTWADQSGLGNDAVQSTVGNRPVVTHATWTGAQALSFTAGSKHYLSLGTLLGKPANYTIFCTFEIDNVTTVQALFASDASDGSNIKAWGGCKTYDNTLGPLAYLFSDGTHYSSGGLASGVTVVSYPHLIMKRYQSGDNAETFRVNGNAKTRNTPNTAATTNTGTAYEFAIGRYGAFDGSYLTGRILELLVYGAAL